MLIWVFVAIGLMGFGGVIWCDKSSEEHETLNFVFVCFGVLAAIALVIMLLFGVSLAGDTADMEAFYNGNIGAYQTTITDTQAVLTVTQETDNATIPIQGSVEKIGVGGMTAERIKELRDAATKYNSKLAFYHIIKKNIWLSNIYPELPEGLKPVTVR